MAKTIPVIGATREINFGNLSFLMAKKRPAKATSQRMTEIIDSALYWRQLKTSPLMPGREPARKLPWI